MKYLFSHSSLPSDPSFEAVLVSLRKGAEYLQAFGNAGRTYTAVVNLMVEDDDSVERAGSAGCHESTVASKDGVVENLVKTKMLIGRGH